MSPFHSFKFLSSQHKGNHTNQIACYFKHFGLPILTYLLSSSLLKGYMKLILSALSENIWVGGQDCLAHSFSSPLISPSEAEGSRAVGTWGSLTAMARQYQTSMQWIKEQDAGIDPNKSLREINRLKDALCDYEHTLMWVVVVCQ